MPISENITDTYVYDPLNLFLHQGAQCLVIERGLKKQNHLFNRQDILIYKLPRLKDQLEITGPIKVNLYINSTAKNTDFTAKLINVYPNGDAYNISAGIKRININSEEDPIHVEIDLWPTSIVLFEGHQLLLEISSSNFPRYDRNMNSVRIFCNR